VRHYTTVSRTKGHLPHRCEAAIECLRKALVVAPDYIDAMFNLALLLQRKGSYAEAARSQPRARRRRSADYEKMKPMSASAPR
jgi:hypothetical protein